MKRTQPQLLDPLPKPTITGKRRRRGSRGNQPTCHRELNMASVPLILKDINLPKSPKHREANSLLSTNKQLRREEIILTHTSPSTCLDMYNSRNMNMEGQHSQDMKETSSIPSIVKMSRRIDGHVDLPVANKTCNFDDQANRSFDPDHVKNVGEDVGKSHLAFATIEEVGSFSTNSSLAQILQNIINKHGDISKECSFAPSFVLTTMLEGICRVVQELEGKKLDELDCNILHAYDSVLGDAEKMKFNVKWLRLRLGELRDAATSFVETKQATYEKGERMERIEDMKKDLQKQKTDVERLQSIIEENERELAVETHQVERLINKINSLTTRYQCFLNKSLVDGLF